MSKEYKKKQKERQVALSAAVSESLSGIKEHSELKNILDTSVRFGKKWN